VSEPDRLRIATFEDGSQILVTEWVDTTKPRGQQNVGTIALRPHSGATWGPPIELEDAP
jgi:hypothetical protein